MHNKKYNTGTDAEMVGAVNKVISILKSDAQNITEKAYEHRIKPGKNDVTLPLMVILGFASRKINALKVVTYSITTDKDTRLLNLVSTVSDFQKYIAHYRVLAQNTANTPEMNAQYNEAINNWLVCMDMSNDAIEYLTNNTSK